jgi:glycosyltransferase involved in cell wall biosynthesis
MTQLPTLSVVIPAFNEEQSIGSIIQRCLDARERIRQVGQVGVVEIIVVNDGSTDRTGDIARGWTDRESTVRLVTFPTNRGYGAAIQEGFARSSGDLLAFLDADGTCDPNYFGELCHALQTGQAVMALGSRVATGTRMPWVRRIGNAAYAVLLSALSGRTIRDTASGMRVLKRDVLATLYPLPDGLHFTPAMSARALMDDQRVVEVPMPYADRVGTSKLHVMRDGVRFLFAIRDAALLYQPAKVFLWTAVLFVVAGLAWGVYPAGFYWRNQRLEEWMIYRLLLCGLLLTAAFSLLSAGVLADQVLSLVYRRRKKAFLFSWLDRLLHRRRLLWAAGLAFAVAVVIVWPGLLQYARTGHVTIHWSRPLASVFLVQLALLAVVHAVLQKIVELWARQLHHVGPRPGDDAVL